MATDYYWPLMEEVAPKLGVYEPLVEPAREVMEAIVEHTTRLVKDDPGTSHRTACWCTASSSAIMVRSFEPSNIWVFWRVERRLAR
jgi:hypothetical protein